MYFKLPPNSTIFTYKRWPPAYKDVVLSAFDLVTEEPFNGQFQPDTRYVQQGDLSTLCNYLPYHTLFYIISSSIHSVDFLKDDLPPLVIELVKKEPPAKVLFYTPTKLRTVSAQHKAILNTTNITNGRTRIFISLSGLLYYLLQEQITHTNNTPIVVVDPLKVFSYSQSLKVINALNAQLLAQIHTITHMSIHSRIHEYGNNFNCSLLKQLSVNN